MIVGCLIRWADSRVKFCLSISVIFAQICLLIAINEWKKTLDKRGFGGPFHLIYRVFDYPIYDHLLAKLAAYGLEFQPLLAIFSYLTERFHRTKTNNAYNSHLKIIFGVPQRSILGSLLFSISICSIFLEVYDADHGSHADNNTSCTYETDLNIIISKLFDCTLSLSNNLKEIT